MPRVELAPGVLDDFDRIVDHLVDHGAADAPSAVADVMAALRLLADHPDIGRRLRGHLRELVIGEGARGYLALYRHLPALGLLVVLAVRHQRERSYRRDTGRDTG